MYLHLPLTGVRPSGDAPLMVASRMHTETLSGGLRIARLTLPVWRVAARSEGCLGVTLAADPIAGEWLTLSAWTDRAAVGRFVGGPAHRRVVGIVERCGGITTAFAFWSGDRSPLRSGWPDARRRLAAAPVTYYPDRRQRALAGVR